MIDENTARKALDAARTGAGREFFYRRISSPDWISPLKELGEFSDPPSMVKEGAYRRYPRWPQADYLLRMAQETVDPDVYRGISQILEELPDFDNQRVYLQLTKVALELPPALAMHWSRKVRRWLHDSDQVSLLDADLFGELALYLARGGFEDQALYFFRDVLAVFPDSRQSSDLSIWKPSPRTRIPQLYDVVVDEYVPPLVELTGIKALEILLIPLLDEALQYSVRDSDEVQDYSNIWRPKIEAPTRYDTEPQEILTSALVNAVIQLSDRDSSRVPDLVQLLESQDPFWPALKRIALFLLQKHPGEARNIAVQHILNTELMNDFTVEREYAMLVEVVVDDLSVTEQNELIAHIMAGPKVELPEEDREDSVSEYERFVEHWQWRRLGLIKNYLTGAVLDRFAELEREYGDPSDYYERDETEGSTWVGPTSPKSTTELAAMSAVEVVDFLTKWEPSGERRSPSPEGLSRALSKAVSAEPAEYAALANRFRDLDPTYVKGLISGLEKAEAPFDWEPVLALCEWVVTQPRDPSSRQFEAAHEMDADPDWGWTRKRIASLVRRVGLRRNNIPIPFRLREQVWSVLESLTRDPDPIPEKEGQYGDPFTHSINAVRSEALHAVVEYAWWVREHVLDEANQDEPTPAGFRRMPEARNVLGFHLDLRNDSSLAVRSVYGRWYPRLYYVDREWAIQRVDEIFPTEDDRRGWFKAAWDAYLLANGPFNEMYEHLRSQYEAAVEQLGEGRDFDLQSSKDLAEHLMAYYWRGLDDEEDGLLWHFLARANGDLRRHAVWWAGREMKYWYFESDEDKEDVLGRMRRFWEARIVRAREAASSQSYVDELEAFAWWFLSEQFEEGYALSRLAETFEITHWTRKYREVLEKLSELSHEYPEPTLRCLRYLVSGRGPKSVHFYGATEESARAILGVALESGNANLVNDAKEVIDLLLARQLFQFHDMTPVVEGHQ